MSRDIIPQMTRVKGQCDYFPGVDGGSFPLPTGSRRRRGPPGGRLLWERVAKPSLARLSRVRGPDAVVGTDPSPAFASLRHPLPQGEREERKPLDCFGAAAPRNDGSAQRRFLIRAAEPVVERIAGAADGADRVGVVATVDRLAQAADMDIHGALIDIDFVAPDAVEQLLA